MTEGRSERAREPVERVAEAGPCEAVNPRAASEPQAGLDGCHAPRAVAPRPNGSPSRSATVTRPDPEVAAHLPLVRAIAARLYRARWSDALPFEEYVQMGALGLLEAAQRYDGARGVTFGAFASWRITGSILNALEHATEQHQQLAGRRRWLVGGGLASMNGAHGGRDDPSTRADRDRANPEVQGEGPDLERVGAGGRCAATDAEALEGRLVRLAAVAAGRMVGFMLEGTGMYSDGAEATRRDGCAALAARDLARRLRGALALLSPPERHVLEAHYFEQRAFADIAHAMDLSRGRISQIHRRALERLREALGTDAAASDFEA